MWLADLFLPARDDRFLRLLVRHADILAEVARKFRLYLDDGSPALADDIHRLELDGDEALRQVTDALRDTYITPLDRQDIYGLAEAIDDFIDYLDNAAREIALFEISATDHMKAIAQTLEGAAGAIAAAVKDLRADQQQAWALARQAQSAENVVEDRYRLALVELFAGNDVALILKQREVYRHLSNSADRADSIGRLIGKIVVKAV